MGQGTVNAKKKGKTHEKGHKNQALSHVNKGKHSANRSDIIMAICASALGRWMDWTSNGG